MEELNFNAVSESGNYISHLGKAHDDNPPGRGSGRYAWGEGERMHQHDWDVYNRYRKLKGLGMTDAEIARAMGVFKLDKNGDPIIDKSTGEPLVDVTRLKAEKQIATNTVKIDKYNRVKELTETVNPQTGKNYTPTEIGRMLGVNESSIRSMLTSGAKGSNNKTFDVADTLKEAVKEKGMIDVGAGTELFLDVSPDRLKTSLEVLKKEGYEVHVIPIKQIGGSNGEQTNIKVLCPPGTDFKTAFKNRLDIKSIEGGDSVKEILNRSGGIDPVRVDLNRVKVLFDEEGGTDRDGMIQLRAVRDENGNLVPACPDLSIGNAKYAQIRIATEGDHYIKGMAVYSDELPKGVDILVNSNKSITKGKEGALKNLEKDAEGNLTSNPFGASVIQTTFKDPKTGEIKQSAINFVGAPKADPNDTSDAHVEGRWGDWSKNLPSQFLGKQSLAVAQQQLKLKVKEMEDRYSELQSLNNPIVKKKMLQKFSDECDAAAVELKAAPFAGQSTHVLLPVKSLKDTEIYAPNFANGTTVALVRFPHAGPFEIPILKVNNNNKEAKSFMKNAKDAVGINEHTASKLSGADFDGDTALVIPMTRKNSSGEFEKSVNILSAPSLPGLDGYNPTKEYGVDNPRMKTKVVDGEKVPAYKIISEHQKQIEMGVASNLITDMYAKGGCSEDELARAVKYSMVVIDSKKHKLDWKQAEADYGIKELKNKYQANSNGTHGASSLLSKAKGDELVDARQQGYNIDPDTGKKIFRAPSITTTTKREPVKVEAPAGYVWRDSDGKPHKSKYMKDSDGKFIVATYDGKVVKNNDGTYSYDKGSGKQKWVNGKTVNRTQHSTKMYEADDARQLLSDNPSAIERAYADYANHMKTMGNEARKASLQVSMPKVDPVARKKYATEVKSLQDKLVEAKKNSVRERQAQLLATSLVNAECDKRDDMDSDDRRKLKGQALKQARIATGASKTRVKFTEKEWEAVNHNAVSPSFLTQLLDNADSDNYTQLAMPKSDTIGTAKRSRVKALYNAGWTQEEIAKAVGISQSSISSILK